MKEARITYLDTARSVAILLVLLGHSLQYIGPADAFWTNRVWLFIYSFHMPLFMVISGYFFGHSLIKPFPIVLKDKILQLLLPCLSWSVLFVLLYTGACLVLYHTLHLPPLFSELCRFWYLKALFSIFFIAFLARKIISYDWAACLISIVLVSLIPKMNVFNVSTMYPFFWVGYFLHKYHDSFIRFSGRIGLSCVGLFILMFPYWNAGKMMYVSHILLVDVNRGGVNWDNLSVALFRFLIGAAGSVAVLALFQWVERRYSTSRISCLCNTVGRETLGIYLIQVWMLETVFSYWHLSLTGASYYIAAVAVVTVETAVCLSMIRLLKYNRWTGLLLLGWRK